MLPNLIIPGAQKCGTSSLAEYLRAHPACVMSDPKEPSFFSRHANMGKLREYESVFKVNNDEKIVFEATTGYFFEPYAARRIRKVLGEEIKIIVILRSPVRRCLSAFYHLAKRGHELRSLEQVVLDLPSSPEEVAFVEQGNIIRALDSHAIVATRYSDRYDDFLWPFRYVTNSIYPVHIVRYLEVFPRENVLFCFLEDLEANPTEVFDTVCQFLDIDATHKPDNLGKVFNRTVVPPGVDINQPRPPQRRGWLARLFPEIARKMRARERRVVPDYDQIPESVIERLSEILSPQMQDVVALTGGDVAEIWR